MFPTVVLRPAGANLKVVFGSGTDQQLIDEVTGIWDTLNPTLYDTVEQAIEETQSVAHMLMVHDGSRNMFEEAPGLMNGFEIVQMVNITDKAQALQSMTSMLTVSMIQQLVGGTKTLLHAAAIGDPHTGRALVLVGESGSGKTTAARFLGERFAYLTDETTIIERGTRTVVPYPKPLSVIVAEGEPKEQLNPAVLGLNVVAADDKSYRVERIVMLDRRNEPTVARVEPVPLGQALMSISEQTSGLMFIREGLRSIADLFVQCGGVWRLVYSEIEQAQQLVCDLLEGSLPEREKQQYHTFEVEDRLPNVFANGTVTVARAHGSEGYLVGERFLLHRGESLSELSPFAAECWITAGYELARTEHFEQLAGMFEGLPQDAYDAAISELVQRGILSIRTVDDPLYTNDEVLEGQDAPGGDDRRAIDAAE